MTGFHSVFRDLTRGCHAVLDCGAPRVSEVPRVASCPWQSSGNLTAEEITMNTQTVVKKSRFQIDQLEDRIAPTSATVSWSATASATLSPEASTTISATGSTTTSFSSSSGT